MKVWITKYALTKGVLEKEVNICGDGMVKEADNRFPVYYHGDGKERHKTKESAFAKAKEMRQKKIAFLRKQIEKLEKLRFDNENNKT